MSFYSGVLFLAGCTATQHATAPKEQRVPARFDFAAPSQAKVGSTDITVAIVKPLYVGKNPEYYVEPFKEMATSMGNDFEELLTYKGFTVRGPFASRDEMVFNDKVNSSFILEIGIDLKPLYNIKYTTSTKTNWAGLVSKYATPTVVYKTSGEVTLAGNLVINAKSSQYGELIFKKNIALEASSFTYEGSWNWTSKPNFADELNMDNGVYNKLSRELEKFYLKTLNLAWQQIDPAEMKTVAEQAKKADKKGS